MHAHTPSNDPDPLTGTRINQKQSTQEWKTVATTGAATAPQADAEVGVTEQQGALNVLAGAAVVVGFGVGAAVVAARQRLQNGSAVHVSISMAHGMGTIARQGHCRITETPCPLPMHTDVEQ